PLREQRPISGRREERADAGTGGANPLGEIALRNELELEESRAVLRVEMMRIDLSRKRADNLRHPPRLDESREPGVAVARVVVDDRETARTLRHQGVDQAGGHAGGTEAAQHDRRAIGNVRDGCGGAGDGLVDHGRSSTVAWGGTSRLKSLEVVEVHPDQDDGADDREEPPRGMEVAVLRAEKNAAEKSAEEGPGDAENGRHHESHFDDSGIEKSREHSNEEADDDDPDDADNAH